MSQWNFTFASQKKIPRKKQQWHFMTLATAGVISIRKLIGISRQKIASFGFPRCPNVLQVSSNFKCTRHGKENIQSVGIYLFKVIFLSVFVVYYIDCS